MPRVRRVLPTEKDQPLGLVCRVCGCQHFRVIYLKRIAGAIVRRRECRYCGRRVSTREAQA